MKNSVERVWDDELHEELLDTDLGLDLVGGQPQVELLLSDPVSEGPEVAVYCTPLAQILDTFIEEHEPENLRIVSEFLQGYLDRIVMKLLEPKSTAE